jgi:hypothetical protein
MDLRFIYIIGDCCASQSTLARRMWGLIHLATLGASALQSILARNDTMEGLIHLATLGAGASQSALARTDIKLL